MLRRPTTKAEPAEPTATRDIEQIDVTRLSIVLDNGINLDFDWENFDGADGYVFGEKFLSLTMGSRTVRFLIDRILYIDVRPAKQTRIVTPK